MLPPGIQMYQDYSLLNRKEFVMDNSIYLTVPQSPRYEQINLFDLLAGTVSPEAIPTTLTGTRTIKTANSANYYKEAFIDDVGMRLIAYADKYAELRARDRHTLYDRFAIPKKTGGLRKINKPHPEMSVALIELRNLLSYALPYGYHTSAYAYVKGRQTLDAVKRHKANESKWFLKLDMSDFFGNTTKEFVLSMLNHIAPFNLINERPEYRKAMEEALDLAFLDGGLPQGSELSPMLTNIVMIPFDYELNRALEDVGVYTYTRYADDLAISCRHSFDAKKIEQVVNRTLKKLDAPYSLKEEKTKYGSSAGSNWLLGLMLNREGDITIGHKNKKRFRAMCHDFITHESMWELEDMQHLAGLLSYYDSIEPEYFTDLINKINERHHTDFRSQLKKAMKVAKCF